MSAESFDPLSYENLGQSISRAMDEQPLTPLMEISPFNGAGIYALYYAGHFEPYSRVAESNRLNPGSQAIYIGKAESDRTRKATPTVSAEEVGDKLFRRLNDHRKSILAAENLNIDDFQARYLVVSPTWVPLAEMIALREHSPLWNRTIDGFGNHNPGAGRRNSRRSSWDTLHPGRPWAKDLQEGISIEAIAENIRRHYTS